MYPYLPILLASAAFLDMKIGIYTFGNEITQNRHVSALRLFAPCKTTTATAPTATKNGRTDGQGQGTGSPLLRPGGILLPFRKIFFNFFLFFRKSLIFLHCRILRVRRC